MIIICQFLSGRKILLFKSKCVYMCVYDMSNKYVVKINGSTSIQVSKLIRQNDKYKSYK